MLIVVLDDFVAGNYFVIRVIGDLCLLNKRQAAQVADNHRVVNDSRRFGADESLRTDQLGKITPLIRNFLPDLGSCDMRLVRSPVFPGFAVVIRTVVDHHTKAFIASTAR